VDRVDHLRECHRVVIGTGAPGRIAALGHIAAGRTAAGHMEPEHSGLAADRMELEGTAAADHMEPEHSGLAADRMEGTAAAGHMELEDIVVEGDSRRLRNNLGPTCWRDVSEGGRISRRGWNEIEGEVRSRGEIAR